ncbi:restriction endonuclease [Pseudomonas citronellolis]|uniref:HNH endonuclease n=1 Tax=Pseudomonas citronellolis TaxID=53408 RepID=UPI002270A220|nr:restriction endonuclease [Pseudomonas citronellolis]WAB92473.1 restriction endonuclease [Pseudomonas citronellolis]
MSIQKIRSQAFLRQSGRCIYCGCPMWQTSSEQFAHEHRVTRKQALAFRCTAEHLHAQCDGGTNAPGNIAAACWFCNSQRHRAARPLTPDAYRAKVQRRMEKGGWHVARPT